MSKKRFSITTPLLAATTVLLIAANLLLGLILVQQSMKSMQSLIRARMLDISNTAASLLDGDEFRRLEKNKTDSPEYQKATLILRSFQDNIELEYIYGVRDEGDRFSFTIDPSDDPGEFGEDVVTTEALKRAARGVASVDEEPYEDRWGRFYSAYSPIFDKNGQVAGIVAVDFSAKWYEERIRSQIIAVVLVCSASTVVGILMAFTVSARIRRRFTELYKEMNSLADDFEDLSRMIRSDSDSQSIETFEMSREPEPESKDEITMLAGQIRSMKTELSQYLKFVNAQAYTDTMTGVRSKTAYMNKIGSINRQIAEDRADFSVAVFDINGLKAVNDNYGHEIGDHFIIGAATAIKGVFGAGNVYRIGGDEFIAVLDHSRSDEIKILFDRLEEVISGLNSGKIYPVDLSVSMGVSMFDKKLHTEYRQVFKLADEAMYRCKCEYYEKRGGK